MIDVGFSSFADAVPVLTAVFAVLLLFAGRKIAKAAVFLAAGAVTAVFAADFLSPYFADVLVLLAALAGFVVGGLIGLFFLKVGVGLAVGLLGFSVASFFGVEMWLAAVAGLAFFIVGVILADKVLALATVFLGGLLLFQSMTAMGLPLLLTAPAILVLAVAGIYVQTRKR